MPITADTRNKQGSCSASGLPDATGGPATDEGALQPLILIVEDEPEICRMIKEVLRQRYRVQQSINGKKRDLKHCIEEAGPIITDSRCRWWMHGCNHIKKQYLPTSAIPIIMLTGVSNKGNGAGKHTASHWLASSPKPFEASMLLSLAGTALSKKQILKLNAYWNAVGSLGEIGCGFFDEEVPGGCNTAEWLKITWMMPGWMNMPYQLSDISNKTNVPQNKTTNRFVARGVHQKHPHEEKLPCCFEQQNSPLPRIAHGIFQFIVISKCFQSEFGVTPQTVHGKRVKNRLLTRQNRALSTFCPFMVRFHFEVRKRIFTFCPSL